MGVSLEYGGDPAGARWLSLPSVCELDRGVRLWDLQGSGSPSAVIRLFETQATSAVLGLNFTLLVNSRDNLIKVCPTATRCEGHRVDKDNEKEEEEAWRTVHGVSDRWLAWAGLCLGGADRGHADVRDGDDPAAPRLPRVAQLVAGVLLADQRLRGGRLGQQRPHALGRAGRSLAGTASDRTVGRVGTPSHRAPHQHMKWSWRRWSGRFTEGFLLGSELSKSQRRCVDVQTGELKASLAGHQGPVGNCFWTAAGGAVRLASCDKTGAVCVWA
jgi:hypothetical protein